MTSLFFVVDFIKERVGVSKMENKEVKLYFDEESITTFEEVLQTGIEKVLLKRHGPENPFLDHLTQLDETDRLYLNDKEQLIKIVKITRESGKEVEVHNILSFDVSKLPQAKLHKYNSHQD
eukprot:CAMPEP_0168622876 /NCGR_PEP_ID=MMETSP0449_2-20121227/8516_1 /TAXON_ID=1082188 /ORGANISM="Strombidium rassoulzadegani, Strain ras09" /LENGTH=120 /DNA_ID=CAMNT_0008664201 /DNA_START=20 /DNA_END=382 /DNA_ORIENTATION=+